MLSQEMLRPAWRLLAGCVCWVGISEQEGSGDEEDEEKERELLSLSVKREEYHLELSWSWPRDDPNVYLMHRLASYRTGHELRNIRLEDSLSLESSPCSKAADV